VVYLKSAAIVRAFQKQLLFTKRQSVIVDMATTVMPLSQLAEGAKGIITELEQSPIIVQLLEMGMVPGVEVEVYKIAPLGDPMVISVSGTEVTLRKNEAAVVLVQSL
jgi:ferrous iron transport protein A